MSAIDSFAEFAMVGFIDVYSSILEEHPEQTGPFKATELRTLMWARMMASRSGMAKQSFKIPFENLKKTKLQFPYMPEGIKYSGCCAIKKNGDLYTPCCGKTKDSDFCQSCSVDKEGNQKELPYGTVEDREENIATGKFTPITYGTWLKKSKKTLSEVYDLLGENGISLEIPAEQLETREVPKNRKGRPAKKSKEDDDGYTSASSSVSATSKASSKSSKASSKSSKSSKSDKPKPKAKKAKEPEPEPEAPKKKEKKAKKAKAESEDEAPKEKKAKAEKPKAKKAKAESEDEAPKEKKAKAEKPKAEKPKAEKPKKAKAKVESDSEDEAPKPKPKAKKAKEPEPEEEDSAELQAEEAEEEQVVHTIKGKEYTETAGRLFDEDGTMAGHINSDGEPELDDSDEEEEF